MRREIRCGGKPMTAVVLAGGRGRRMKADKAGLPVGGTTLLGHVLDQVEPLFEEILVAAAPEQKIAGVSGGPPSQLPRGTSPALPSAPRVRVIRDERPGLGPIGGLLTGLKEATNDACAVIACDIPDIDARLLRKLAQASVGAEIAVPVGPSGLHEPLFAVYRKSIVTEIEALLERGERSLLPLYDRCRTAVVRFDDPRRVRNLNTRSDYEAYLGSNSKGLSATRVKAGPRRNRRDETKRA